jgi:hypothetical protein
MSEPLTDIIQRIFPTDAFTITTQESSDKYLQIYIKDKRQRSCVTFRIKEDSIYVEWLTKCDSGSGTALLHKVEQFASEIGIFKIILEDASQVITPCYSVTSLRMLSILTTGKSWYNKLGYTSKNQVETDSYNNSLIQMLFSDFIDMVKRTIQYNEEHKINLSRSMNSTKFNELIEYIKSIDILDLKPTDTTQEVFIKIKNMLKPGQPCRDIEPYLELLIEYIRTNNILKTSQDDETKILHTETNTRGGMKRKITKMKRKGTKKKRKGTKKKLNRKT